MTAPTSDERREVAERLRQMADRHDVDKHDVIHAFDDADIRKLADLIDPTCHVVTSGEWHGSPVDSVCSECFSPLYRGMRYCTHCGCRVVTDHGRD